jgi:periplasmic divalent cation tolerance protein
MAPMSQPLAALAWCPFPDRATARAVAEQLLDEELIACANLLGEVEAVFQWEDERSSARETPVLFKTDARRLERMIARLGALHPYETPAIVGWHCDAAHPSTLAWLTTPLAQDRA